MTRSTTSWLGAAALLAASLAFCAPIAAHAQGKGEIKIAHVYSRTGPLEAYGKQTAVGLQMGLNYATGGTMGTCNWTS